MSSTINIYEANAEDFDCEGLGTLCPLEWTYKNKGIGGAVLTMTHPYDAEGRWQLIQAGRILRADVPVRTVPEIDAGALVQTAEVWTVRAGATKAQRYLYSAATKGKGKKIKLVPAGAEVTVTQYGDDRYLCYYRAQVRERKRWRWKSWRGCMDKEALDVKVETLDTSTLEKVEQAIPSVQVRPQLFRLQQPKKKDDEIEAEALPIAYDAAGILCDPYIRSQLTGVQALQRILDSAYMDTDVELYTDIGDSRVGFEKRNVNIIDALLNGDDSFVGRFGGDVLLDDNRITILRSAGVDRGFYATYGRNLVGIDSYEVSDDIVTAYLPVGETENGDPLYLDGTKYVISPNYDQFPVPHMAELKVSDAKVNKKEGVTVAVARTRMREAVAAKWEEGAHIPAITLKVKFALLGDSEEYKAFRQLDQCHMYDIVHVWHPLVCGYVDMAVCECEWDGMQERYTAITVGAPGHELSGVKVYAGSISGSVSGRQIAWNAVSAGQLQDECITTRHVQAESITAQAMNTQSLTAETAFVRSMNALALAATTAKINSITAQTISTDTLAVAFAKLVRVAATNIQAGTVTAGALDAALASIVTLTARYGTFDYATVQHLVASAMHLTQGVGECVFIENLSVAYAQIVDATLNRLVLRSREGNYYELTIDDDTGAVSTKQVTVTSEEAAAGQTTGGRNIVETDITAAHMATADLQATFALVNQIDAARIDVDQLFAREAFIQALTTSQIFTGEGALTISAMRTATETAQAAAHDAQDAADEAQATADAKADPLTGTASGHPIAIADGASAALGGLVIYGKSTQSGTPMPDSPVAISTAGGGGSLQLVSARDAQGTGAITAALPTPNGLPGIPVSSGGNYTDANNQQWICDTVDMAAGTYTRRVGTAVCDGSTDEGWTLSANLNYIFGFSSAFAHTIGLYNSDTLEATAAPHMTSWSTGRTISTWQGNDVQVGESYISGAARLWIRTGYSTLAAFKAALAANPMTFIFPLPTPVTTPLTEQQRAALMTMRTFSGGTVLYNDGGADMAVVYATQAGGGGYVETVRQGLDAGIGQARSAATAAQGTADEALELAQSMAAEQSLWFTFDPDRGFIVQRKDESGRPVSIWSTVTDEVGFHIANSQVKDYVFSAERDRVVAQKLSIGDVIVKASASGGQVWVRG